MFCAARGAAVVWGLATLVGCTGFVRETDNTIDESGNGGAGGGGVNACGRQGPTPGPMPRVARLTHAQYRNSVQDLLHIPVMQTSDFAQDVTFAGYDNNAAGLNVSAILTSDYRRAAEEIAAQAVADDAAFDQLLPCEENTADDACVQRLIADLTRRAYRRPLTTEEAAAHFELFQAGRTLYDGSEVRNGTQLLIEAILQSPLFLYRVELSDRQDGDRVIPLSGYEVASRLSFMLWNTLPDTTLLDAARDGILDTPAGIESHARRLLNDERAADSVDDFHRQWLHYDDYEDLAKSPSLHPDWDPAIGDALVEETQRFIRHVVLEQESTYTELMTASYGFVNQELADIYGVEGTFGSSLSSMPVNLDPTQRAGLITKAGFLASHAYPNQDSPIHRGVFVQRQFLCTTLRPPTFQIDPNLPALSDTIRTTRQQVEEHTAAVECQQCHGTINPTGFAFSHYDATGAYRTEENGESVDSSGSLMIDGERRSFEDAVEVARLLAQSEQSQRCYLSQWFQYANGRVTAPEDVCTLDALHEQMRDGDYNIKELLVALTQTRTFRYRAVEVSP